MLAAILFALVTLGLQLWKSWVLLAGYDQGIFQQVAWNSLHGHWFESSLSSQLSTNVVHAGQLPFVGYERLGQHFTPTLLLWAPLLAVFGAAALPVLQVGLITAAGLVLHRLASSRVPARTANWLVYAYFAGNALIGPTLGNFSDLCQLPLAVFGLMLGLLERRRRLIWVAAVLMPLIREDTGVVLVAMDCGSWFDPGTVVPGGAHRLGFWMGHCLHQCADATVPTTTANASGGELRSVPRTDPKRQQSWGDWACLSQPALLVQQRVDPPENSSYLLGHSLRSFSSP